MPAIQIPVVQEVNTVNPAFEPMPSGPRSFQVLLKNKYTDRLVTGGATVRLFVSNDGRNFKPYLTDIVLAKVDTANGEPGDFWVTSDEPYGFVCLVIKAIDPDLIVECHIGY